MVPLCYITYHNSHGVQYLHQQNQSDLQVHEMLVSSLPWLCMHLLSPTHCYLCIDLDQNHSRTYSERYFENIGQ